MLFDATRHLGAANVVGAAVFAATMVLLYLTSTLYHALPPGRAKRVFMKLDHGAIYLFIAGSYTPFALGVLGGPWGWTLFGLVWSIAAVGVTLKAFDRLSHPWLSTGLYLAMGWLALIATAPLLERVPSPGLVLLLAGGLAYTVGVVFFMLDSRVRYAHTVWHGFVVDRHRFPLLRGAELRGMSAHRSRRPADDSPRAFGGAGVRPEHTR